MIKQFLKLKTKKATYGIIYRNRCLSQDYVELKAPLYNDFYLTRLGIFRFGNPMFFKGSTILNSPDLVLPKIPLPISKSVNP